jgi:FeS assembly SUF system regulator
MLRISRIADYGVVINTRLATLTSDEVRSVRDLSDETGVPQPTVSKILKQLARGGVVQSARGAQGGYRLARRADELTVAEVVTALEGPIGVTDCWRDESDDCELSTRCGVRGNWQRINQAISAALAGVTLAEMAEPPSRLVALRRGRAQRAAPAEGCESTRPRSAAAAHRGAP